MSPLPALRNAEQSCDHRPQRPSPRYGPIVATTSALSHTVGAPSGRADRRGVLLWLALAAVGIAVGGRITSERPGLHTNAAPFHGRWDPQLRPGLAIAVALAGLVVWQGPRVARRARWGLLLTAAPAAAFAWAVALSIADGAAAFTRPLRSRYDYLAGVPAVVRPGPFLRHFVEVLPTLPTHVKGHPPGLVLVFWLLDRVGLGGPLPAAVLVVAVGASAVAAVLIAVRQLVGEHAARAAAPYPRSRPWRGLARHVGRCVLHRSRRVGGRHDRGRHRPSRCAVVRRRGRALGPGVAVELRARAPRAGGRCRGALAPRRLDVLVATALERRHDACRGRRGDRVLVAGRAAGHPATPTTPASPPPARPGSSSG